jgi:DNA-binding SARP family transcriptional activator/pimeloyl-ACP methyl ester carboxylesterase
MEFRLLGPLEAEHEGARLPLGGPRQRAVLALLLLDADRVVSRHRLADELWPAEAPDSAPKMVQAYVSGLRRVLPEGTIRTHPSGYSIHVGDGSLDLHHFERLFAQGRDALSAGEARTASELLREGLALWRGRPLQELAAPLAVAELRRLEDLHLAALETRIEADLALGRHAGVIGELETLVAAHPLRERLRASQMLALYRSGRQSEALAAYRDARETLVEELGLEPSPLLRDLERRILEHDEAIDTPPPAEPRRTGAPATPGMAPPVRYASNGGVSLAYQVFGDGTLDLLLVTGWVLPMELAWDDPDYVHFLERLGSFSRVVLWDKRGTGLSDRFPSGALPTLEQRMEDLGVVMDAAGCERAAVLGMSEGVGLAALFAAAHPDRTTALALYGGWARTLTSPGYPGGYEAERYDALVEHMRTQWSEPSTFLGLWAPSALGDPRFRRWWSRALHLGASPAAALDWLRLVRGVDIRDVLPVIDVPTIVAHREGDFLVPKENSRYIADRIPGAAHVELPGEDHLWWVGDHDALIDAVEGFLMSIPERREPERVLATVVVAHPAGPSEEGAPPGTPARRGLTRAQQTAVRAQADRFGGAHVRSSDRGVRATFAGPSRAIRFADTVRAEARSHGLELAIGMHTGECDVDGTDVSGVAVDMAAEIGSLATAGEILVSGTVEELVHGSGIAFEDRGTRRLATAPGERRLLAVSRA